MTITSSEMVRSIQIMQMMRIDFLQILRSAVESGHGKLDRHPYNAAVAHADSLRGEGERLFPFPWPDTLLHRAVIRAWFLRGIRPRHLEGGHGHIRPFEHRTVRGFGLLPYRACRNGEESAEGIRPQCHIYTHRRLIYPAADVYRNSSHPIIHRRDLDGRAHRNTHDAAILGTLLSCAYRSVCADGMVCGADLERGHPPHPAAALPLHALRRDNLYPRDHLLQHQEDTA